MKNAPLITALAVYVPPPVALDRWQDIEPTPHETAPSGWDAWIASWRREYGARTATAKEAASTDLNDASAEGASNPRVDRAPVELEADQSGLAARVTHAICAARHREAASIDFVIFCHTSLNEHVSTTVAGRLRTIVGTPCFPFSVSQQQGASLFTALQLATDLLIAEPDARTILIVAADKWCPPFSRWTGQAILHGDAAGAILVERPALATRGLQLIDASAHPLHRASAHPPLSRAGIECVWAPALLSTIDAMLARHGLHSNGLAATVGQAIDPKLDDLVCRHLGVCSTEPRRCAYLGAADSIIRLARTLGSHRFTSQDRILMWGIGLGGYTGCALLAAHGFPSILGDVDSHNSA
ncbi:MAG: 3-oxoacyl-ACP synthase [Pandoraea sp.]|uniref:3-oxoacyl-ACP synthase n=1 Tax=Pandoraea sp. TaxID=1883445 RepID=UPI0011FD6778|nr:3-oxoacyl-ACP synthase [Pandoraea sp.]TAM18575.1 MAG: 3-oxoacyl-ACP synthase [Pandoraea sp.]